MPRRSARKPAKKRTVKSRRPSSRKSHKYRVKLLSIISIFIVSIAFLGGVGLYNNLNKHFASADSPGAYNISDRKIYSVLYLTVNSLDEEPLILNKINMIFIDKGTKKLVRYEVPVDYQIDVPGKFGEEPLSKVYALGALNSEDKSEGGLALVKQAVGNLFGYYPDKYIVVDSALSGQTDALFSTGNAGLDVGPVKTDFSLSEFYQMYTLLRSFTSDRFTKTLFNPDTVDDELREFNFESEVSVERASIAILNGSGLPGVATFGSRVVQNMGGRVVFSGNADKVYTESFLVADDLSSDTVKKIVHSFGIKKVLKKGEFNVPENEVGRSDVVLIFGLDRQDQL